VTAFDGLSGTSPVLSADGFPLVGAPQAASTASAVAVAIIREGRIGHLL
jgi:hypothetical protein